MSAQPQGNQERVRTWLENAGLEYTVDSAGIISVNFAVCTVVIGLQHDNFIWVRAVWKANLTRTDAALLQTDVNELNAKRFMPQLGIYGRNTDTPVLRAAVAGIIMEGMSDAQLDEFMDLAIAATEGALRELSMEHPDLMGESE